MSLHLSWLDNPSPEYWDAREKAAVAKLKMWREDLGAPTSNPHDLVCDICYAEGHETGCPQCSGTRRHPLPFSEVWCLGPDY